MKKLVLFLLVASLQITSFAVQTPTLRVMPAVQQQGLDCGIWATCNAAAIYTTVVNKQDLTVEAQQSLARSMATRFITNHGHLYTSEEIEHIAKQLNTPLIILGKNNTGEIVPLNGVLVMKATSLKKDPIAYYKYILRSIKILLMQRGECVVPFVCNLGGGHWVAMVLVCLQGKQPELLYLDSGNGFSPEVYDYQSYIEKIFSPSYLGPIGLWDRTIVRATSLCSSLKNAVLFPFRFIMQTFKRIRYPRAFDK